MISEGLNHISKSFIVGHTIFNAKKFSFLQKIAEFFIFISWKIRSLYIIPVISTGINL